MRGLLVVGWERRAGRYYYYRSTRIGRRVMKQYLGGACVGDIAEEEDLARRAEVRARREAARRLLSSLDASAAPLNALCLVAVAAQRATLNSLGYAQHHRGEWRRNMRTLPKAAESRILTDEESATYDRAIHGDKLAIKEIRKMLDAEPQLANRFGGDAADMAIDLLLERAWKDHPTVAHAMKIKLGELRAHLEGDAPSPLELLLVDRIAACWLHMAHADTLYAGHVSTANHRTVEHLEERRDRAHRRYLSAIRSLAQVRRLILPMVQVNVAGNQLVTNVGK